MSETVTVLVTDLVGSTELRVSVGEDRADELRREHDALLAGVVAEHGGEVVKGLGDGVLALFRGAAEAVAAAVAAQQQVDGLGRRLRAPLAIRVGLSAGDVTLEDGDCFGTPVIEASRLCDAAGDGQILAADLVRLLARGRGGHDFSPVGDLELKGLPDPVPAVSVPWSRAAPPAGHVAFPAALARLGEEIGLAGRATEFDALVDMWKASRSGERRVVLIAGEPGVGKTRLATEVAHRAHDEGATVLFGRCDEGIGVSFQPFVEALRQLLPSVDAAAPNDLLGPSAGELARLAPDLARHIPGLPEPTEADPDTERYRLFEAVAAWLGAAAGDEGLVLVVDDLHWAEKPTLLLLRHLVRSPDIGRVLVLGTYRDTDVDRAHPLSEVLADLRREPGVERVALRGLDVEGVGAFVSAAAGHELDEQGVELARAIWTETEGNPFFVGEVLRSLVESGAVTQQDGRWTTSLAVDDIGIPEGVRDVVGQRLGRLSGEANSVLATAAVVGPEFDLDVVAAVSGIDEDPVLDALDGAVGARLVEEAGVGRYRFAHALVRTTLYEEMSATRLARRHQQVAQALEGRGDTDPAVLAYHWSRVGGDDDAVRRALQYLVVAGDQAMASLASDQALEHYTAALDIADDIEHDDDHWRCEILVKLGTAQRNAGIADHRETLLDAGRQAATLGDARLQAEAALANTRGFTSFVGIADTERLEALDAAIAAVGDRAPALRCRLLGVLATEVAFTGRAGDRFSMAQEALDTARTVGDHDALVDTLRAATAAMVSSYTREQHRAVVEELTRLVDTEQPHWRFEACFAWFGTEQLAGNFSAARGHLDAMIDTAALLGPSQRWLAACYDSGWWLAVGDLERAERRVEKALDLGVRSGQPDALGWYVPVLYYIRKWQDRLAELLPAVDALLESNEYEIAVYELALTHALAETGQHDAARESAERTSPDDVRALPDDLLLEATAYIVADTARILGDTERAEAVLDRLDGYDDTWICPAIYTVAPTSLARGLAAATLGQFETARAHLDHAVAGCEEQGLIPGLGMSLAERGAVVLEVGGRAEDARTDFDRAMAVAERHGLPRVTRAAREAAHRHGMEL